jgi:hypothetical protein
MFILLLLLDRFLVGFSKFEIFKGSRQRERRGLGKVSNIRNMSQTAAIDVLFSFNLAVVFDFYAK